MATKSGLIGLALAAALGLAAGNAVAARQEDALRIDADRNAEVRRPRRPRRDRDGAGGRAVGVT